MIGARQGPPLAIGHGEGEMYLGSDAIALAPFTDTITYLEDGDWAVLTPRDGARSSTSTAARSSARRSSRWRARCWSTRATTATSWPRRSTSSPRSSATRWPTTSISPTGACTCPTSASIRPASRRSPSRPAAPPTTPASSASTGSSAMRACPSRSTSPPSSATASRRCRRAASPLFVSQSGETADTLATLRYCKSQGQRIASIVNVRTSTIAREVGRRAADAGGPRDRRRLHQGLHLPARACWPAWRSRSAARAAPSARRRSRS